MNIQKIEMEPREAREQLQEYQHELRKRADAEYQAVAAGLEALAEGTPIISLPQAIQAGGFDEQMRPRLAIARADRRQVEFRWEPRATLGLFDTSVASRWSSVPGPSMRVSVDLGQRHGRETSSGHGLTVQGYALVPMIPPAARAQSGVRPSRDRDHFILFEVEQWADKPLRAQPDRDPYLLRHLGGDAYAVLAEWDLTDLERLVMAGRRGN